MHRGVRCLLLFVVIARSLTAQNAPAPNTPPPVLARLERLQQHEDVCTLIARDGNYRLERRYATKLEVFVGSLLPVELEELNRILDGTDLQNISSNDVQRPMIMDTIDSFLIDVYRAGGELHLTFSSPDARKRFRSGIDPLLKWLERLPKLQHVQLTASGASHCMPAPLRSDLKTTSQENSPQPTYLLSLVNDYFRVERVERNCVIVYANGKYRQEKTKQEYMGKIQLHAFEGSLSSDQIEQLRELLDVAVLKNMKHDTEPKAFSSEADATLLTIPRGSAIQRLKFSHAFQVVGNRDMPGGYSGMQYVVDSDERVLDPLRAWLKTHIVENNARVSEGASPTNCEPSH
jgi:hypothetical protein